MGRGTIRTHASHALRSVMLAAGMAGPVQAQGSGAAAPDVDEALRTGCRLLLEWQERYESDPPLGRLGDAELGKWQAAERQRLAGLRAAEAPGVEWPYEGVYRVPIDGKVSIPPGYRVGGTAIVCCALLLAPEDATADAPAARLAALERAFDFMLDTLAQDELLAAGPKQGYDVRGWGHAYALEAFLLAMRTRTFEGQRAARVAGAIPGLIECLAANEIPGGGWNYANDREASPFMTGSTLLPLFQARAQGFDVDEPLVERALAALERARSAEGAYVYSGVLPPAVSDGDDGAGSAPRDANRMLMPGAAARASIAELCLLLAGRSDQDRLRVAVEAFFAHWDDLLARKSQQGTHAGPYGIAPYYFFYGHTYAALAIEQLPEAERPALRERMQQTLWRTREPDGSWNDRIFPRSASYSTAMALLALLAPQREAPAGW